MTIDPHAVDSALAAAAQATRDAHLAAQGAASAGTELVVAGTDAALAVKSQLAAAHTQVATARKAAIAAQAEAKALIQKQKDALDAQLRAMAAELEPLMETVARLQEGIYTLNLYTGRDQEIVTLATGNPAPATTPIHVRQQVLAMDEESALAAETGGIDVRSITAFDEWITANPAHLDQILPEARGVVALMVRREARDYGDPWSNVALNEANQQTWWLIRNGDNLYRMLTDFNVGRRLVPARNEFTSFFVDRRTGAPLQPGTSAWLEAEKAAGARERHFMKIALILQGLVDRTAVFAPLPVAGLSLLSPEHYDAGHVVLIADDENQLTSGRTPFYEWLAAKNAQLTPGMRVLVNTHHQGWADSSDRGGRYGHARIHPTGAEEPNADQVYTITRRASGGDLVITYPRTRQTWMRGPDGYDELRVPSTPASCRLRREDKFVLPIDLVTVAEMREYLAARTERSAYAAMFPTLKAAIAFKEAEAATEAPFRDLLARQICASDGVDLEHAGRLVDELVTWWKLANRWNRPLHGEPADEARAAAAILAEHGARTRAADRSAGTGKVLADLQAAHPGALFIARKKAGPWVVATPSPRRWAQPLDKASNRYGDQVGPLDVFVDVHEYTATGRPRGTKTWQILEPSVVGRWTMLHTTPAWETWNRRARRADHLTDPEIDHVVDLLIAQATRDGAQFLAASYWEDHHTDGYGNTSLTVHVLPAADLTLPERLLTSAWPKVTSTQVHAEWRRAADGTVTLGRVYRSEKTWSTGFQADGEIEAPWEGHRENTHIVRVDTDLVEATRATALRLVHERARVRRLESTRNLLLESLANDWTRQRWDAAKARFLEDYHDESLWEDHAKTIRVTYPYHRDNDPTRLVHQVVSRLVEDGTPPWGQTVQDVLAAWSEPVPVTDFMGRTRDLADAEVPADLLELRFADEPAGTDLVATA